MDGKGATIVAFSDKNRLLQQDMFWKLRGVLRDQAAAAPVASNSAERSLGVKHANLPDLEDYENKLDAMSVCKALELGLNQLHEAGCALYIKYRYNQAVVDIFLGDEFVGAERKQPLKERMATSVKEVQKLTAQTLKAVGNAGGSFAKDSRRGRGGGWKQQPKQGAAIPPGFEKPKPAAGGQLGGDRPPIQCFKCKEMGHVAANCPNK
jgi:hypothetical protein